MSVPTPIAESERRAEWTGLLEGRVATAVHAAVCDIAKALADCNPDVTDASDLCDRALLFAYLSREKGEFEDWDERAVRWLNVAVDKAVAGGLSQPALFGGVCGLGWTIQHVTDLLGGTAESSSEDPLEEVDAYMLRALSHYPDGAPYDLISGLVGIGVYFLERLPRERAHSALSLILQLLEDTSELSWGGRTWRTPPEGLPDEQRALCPNGHYNLGVAHGVPGVVFLLAEIAAAGIHRDEALRLLNPVLDWLFARRRPPGAATRFSSWFVPGAEPTDSRLGWCYGDLGVAAVLGHVAARLARAEVTLVSQDLLDRSLGRDSHAGRIQDMGLCHGALGLAHIYNRFSQASGRETYKAAAVEWYQRALAMRQDGIGIAGFFSWRPDNDPPIVADTSMLSGAAGSALALLAATSVVPPAWDRLLLLSGRVPGNAVIE